MNKTMNYIYEGIESAAYWFASEVAYDHAFIYDKDSQV